MTINEQRGYPRLHVVWKATVTRLNGEQLAGSTDNVSREGMNVIVDRSLVLGEPVRVDLVSACHGGQTCYFRLQGVIVYDRCLESRLGHAIGLRLLDPGNGYLHLVQGLEPGAQQMAVNAS